MVSSYVLVYREFYIEGYNQKKYSILLSGFITSIIILIYSNSPVIVFLSWEFLGISSIFLVLFYPNKNNLVNSMWTIFFNRLGDLALIVILSMYTIGVRRSIDSLEIRVTGALLVICISTKSAQFPFNAWLPMAISAPTPVSSMVHSSTLVTAGILLLTIMIGAASTETITYIKIVSCSTFVIGGFIARWSTDFKKIIAYSTMRQIRIICFMLTSGEIIFSLLHTIAHAVFKRSLFMIRGYIFLTNIADQWKIKIRNTGIKEIWWIRIRIYSMRGLTISASFYSKDFIMEQIISDYAMISDRLILLAGGGLTLMYCCKIMSSSKVYKIYHKVSLTKKNNWVLFSLITRVAYLFLFIFSNRSVYWSPINERPLVKFMGAALSLMVLMLGVKNFNVRRSIKSVRWTEFINLWGEKFALSAESQALKNLCLTEKGFFKKVYFS